MRLSKLSEDSQHYITGAEQVELFDSIFVGCCKYFQNECTIFTQIEDEALSPFKNVGGEKPPVLDLSMRSGGRGIGCSCGSDSRPYPGLGAAAAACFPSLSGSSFICVEIG